MLASPRGQPEQQLRPDPAPQTRRRRRPLLRQPGPRHARRPHLQNPWDIPGGAVETDESPRAGAHREIKEELGLDLPPGRFLAIDWTPPRPDRSEGIVLIYDGGHLTDEQLATIQLQPDELRAYALVPPHDIGDRVIPLLARRIHHSVHARTQHTTLYLEDGTPSA
ncbi:NUDIX domain-containing protein [Streptomyces sp. HUAS TT20]|uniref:NUDIX domain-containing protein n=1 Tax=Streptomyces sp. HUAS TT20 TaxID=3447509 RepID=UPI0021D974A0|nr:NUDIX hydrolase [Streptomyces sp. HUAS 15-9]UXY32186.1 NUDIX hydrolase [Streptomyces sp. HUAS 15-9]